jgi:hypothetical protein
MYQMRAPVSAGCRKCDTTVPQGGDVVGEGGLTHLIDVWAHRENQPLCVRYNMSKGTQIKRC